MRLSAVVPLLLVLGVVGDEAGAGRPRYLVYPPPSSPAPTKVQLIFGLGIPMEVEVSTILGWVIKCVYNLPYNASVYTDPFYPRSRRSVNIREPIINRYDIYGSYAKVWDKACLLRAICELAATPLDGRHGLFAQLLHVLLTPSSTSDEHTAQSDQEYQAAELIGLTSGHCEQVFHECRSSFLNHFSETR